MTSTTLPQTSPAASATSAIAPGVWPVMLTPFTDSGEIDWTSLDRLIEWYIGAGAAGLFAVCLSSEMYELTEEERIRLSRHVVTRAAGRVPVIASGNLGGPIATQAEMVRRMHDTGVAGVVVISSQLAEESEPDSVWQSRAEELMQGTGDTPLGLYECPRPYKRLLSPEMLGWAARTSRFVFHKDTVCESAPIHAKLKAVRGTGFRWFNANTPTLLDSLRHGADGYSGIAANFAPSLYVWLCRNHSTQPAKAEKLQRFLSLADAAVRYQYPACSKVALREAGLFTSSYSRIANPPFSEQDLIILRDFQISIREWEQELGI